MPAKRHDGDERRDESIHPLLFSRLGLFSALLRLG